MKRQTLLPLLIVLALAGLQGTSEAGPNANAKLLIHLAPPTTKNACTSTAATPTCNQIVTAGSLFPATYHAYVIAADVDSAAGLGGVQFGISYNGTTQSGVDIFGWYSCADMQFAEPGWPQSGTGNVVTWRSATNCQRPSSGKAIPVGYFYCAAYSQDILAVTARPSDNRALVMRCTPSIVDTADVIPSNARGTASFTASGTVSGSAPCGN